jgi:hypothetical protein
MPSSVPCWNFGPFALDSTNACLWRGAETVALPPKTFDVLHYLVRPPNRLVTKDELPDAVWPETAVTDAVVRVAIGALRKGLLFFLLCYNVDAGSARRFSVRQSCAGDTCGLESGRSHDSWHTLFCCRMFAHDATVRTGSVSTTPCSLVR